VAGHDELFANRACPLALGVADQLTEQRIEMEVVPGIHRIESILGPRPFSQYLLAGERLILVDTGIVFTPEEVILPFLGQLGRRPGDLDLVLITHADVDHFGGNAAIRRAAPRTLFGAHVADVDWIGDQDRIFRERYGWYAAHGPQVDYDEETWRWLREAVGPDVPIDIGFRGGERLRVGPSLAVEILHLPGHSPGHIGLWEPASRTAIITDAALGAGLHDTAGEVIQPPPYFDIAGYVRTLQSLVDLRPTRLLTAHFPIIEGPAVDAFLNESLAFVERSRQAVRDALRTAGELSLAELFLAANPGLGPFTAMPNELCGPLRAHLQELVASEEAIVVDMSAPPRWYWRESSAADRASRT
jgi:glyoxylase-like metal-dependent hydrolase (beta-lactamase superfamily II)